MGDELERMLHAREVRLRGKDEQVVGVRSRLPQQRLQPLAIEPQLRHRQRRVLDGAPRARARTRGCR